MRGACEVFDLGLISKDVGFGMKLRNDCLKGICQRD